MNNNRWIQEKSLKINKGPRFRSTLINDLVGKHSSLPFGLTVVLIIRVHVSKGGWRFNNLAKLLLTTVLTRKEARMTLDERTSVYRYKLPGRLLPVGLTTCLVLRTVLVLVQQRGGGVTPPPYIEV
jgi:hypothetical protein